MQLSGSGSFWVASGVVSSVISISISIGPVSSVGSILRHFPSEHPYGHSFDVCIIVWFSQ